MKSNLRIESQVWQSIIARVMIVGIAIALPLANAHTQEHVSQTEEVYVPPPRTNGLPNIILIMADDLGVEAINIYGGEYYTPNIDRLAAQGVRFDNAHATPLCTPSRVRLMTGLQSWRNYEAFDYLAPDQRTFGKVLQEAGYVTGIVGKWQLKGSGYDGRVGITPEAAGFNESYLWQLRALDEWRVTTRIFKGSRYWGPTRALNGRISVKEEGFGPDDDNEFALNFIDRHKDKPFLLYYPMVLPHTPHVPTPGSMTAQGEKKRFSGMVSYIDQQVGELVEKLEADGLDGNTIVIFTSDNGTYGGITSMRSGYAVSGGKGLPTVNGTHVPMIIWGPGRVPEGKVREGLFDFTDMLPTLAEIAGAPVKPGSVDGVSQWQVIEGKQDSARNSIFMHYAPAMLFPQARFVFDVHWKLYDDGKFVAIDPITGIETEVPPNKRKGEAALRYAAFTKELADTKDGPLDPTRFPMCANQPSLDPSLPATVAGCTQLEWVFKTLENLKE